MTSLSMSATGVLPVPSAAFGDFGQDRYEVNDLLGEGGSGRVFVAFDKRLGREVALKTLLIVDPERVYRLKREFRSLLDIVHPNLVQLHELVVTHAQAFFTMELVRGQDLLSWIREGDLDQGAEEARFARIRSAFGQLALAIATLHANGRVHRDVKPSNVVVAEDGRAVLVDLGLAASLARVDYAESMEGQIVGTFDYMSPEQMMGRIVGKATDWYSFGAVLFEALNGAAPFSGTPLRIMLDLRRAKLHRPQFTVPVPSDLAELALRLLATDPEARPAADEIFEVLAPTAAAPDRVFHGAMPMVGRAQECERLRAAIAAVPLQRKTGIIRVAGASGIGKTSVIESVLSELEDTGTLVLRSRCHYREQVAYRALDGIVDDLGRYLSRRGLPDLTRLNSDRIQELLITFPTLRRVPEFSALSANPADESTSSRYGASLALRFVLGQVAAEKVVILWVDDLQWVDRDSVTLLRILAVPQSPLPFTIVVSYRSDELPEGFGINSLLHGPFALKTEEIQLQPLDVADITSLVEGLVPNVALTQVREIAEATGGLPLFARELCRELVRGDVRVSDVPGAAGDFIGKLMALKIRRLGPDAMQLFDTLCAAGFPVAEEVAIVAAELGDFRRPLASLLQHGLVRYTLQGGSAALEIAHERLREARLNNLDPKQCASIHQRLASAFEKRAMFDPAQAIHHLLHSGSEGRAVQAALDGAIKARERAAFGLAAGLLRRVLDVDGHRADSSWLRARMGLDLCNCGRAHEGAVELARAADELSVAEPRSRDVVRWRAHAGERLIVSGYVEEGFRLIATALDAYGVRYSKTTLRAVASILWNLPHARWARWLWRRRGTRAQPLPLEDKRTELDVLWAAGSAIGTASPIRAMQFQFRHAIVAYEHGELGHIARALALDAVSAAMRGGAARWRKSLALLADAQRLVANCDDVDTDGFLAVQASILAHFMGRWREAVEYADAGVEGCRRRRLGMFTQLGLARWIGLTARVLLGEILDVRSRIQDLLLESETLDDRSSMACLRVGWLNCTWLCTDEVQMAEEQAQIARSLYPFQSFSSFDYVHLIAVANIDLYRGSPELAWRRVEDTWPALARSFQLHLGTVHFEMHDLRARCALATAAREGEPRKRARAVASAKKSIRALHRSSMPCAPAAASVLGACLFWLQGDEARTREALEWSRLEFRRQGMDLHAAACGYQLSVLWSQEMDAQSQAWLRRQEVIRPDRLARMLVPLEACPSSVK